MVKWLIGLSPDATTRSVEELKEDVLTAENKVLVPGVAAIVLSRTQINSGRYFVRCRLARVVGTFD